MWKLEPCVERVHPRWLQIPAFTGRAPDKKSFVWVSESWLNVCESDMGKKINATESWDVKV